MQFRSIYHFEIRLTSIQEFSTGTREVFFKKKTKEGIPSYFLHNFSILPSNISNLVVK